MFRRMKPETIAARDHRRMIERTEQRTRFLENIERAKSLYPQFPFPETLPESNALYIEYGDPGPKGYAPALSISVSRIKFEPAF